MHTLPNAHKHRQQLLKTYGNYWVFSCEICSRVTVLPKTDYVQSMLADKEATDA